MIERRRIWTDALLADYIRESWDGEADGDGGHTPQPGALVSADQPGSRQWGPGNCSGCSATTGALRTACITEGAVPEDVHTLHRPGLGQATLVNRSERPAPGRMVSARMSLPLRAKTCAFRPTQTIARLYGRAQLCNRPARARGQLDCPMPVAYNRVTGIAILFRAIPVDSLLFSFSNLNFSNLKWCG